MQRSSLLAEQQNLRQRLASLRSQDGGGNGKLETNTWRKRCVSLAVNLPSDKDKAAAAVSGVGAASLGGGGESARQRVLSGEPSAAAAAMEVGGVGMASACHEALARASANASRLQVPAIIHSSSMPVSIPAKSPAQKRDANGLVVARPALRSGAADVSVASSAPAVVFPPAFKQLLAAAVYESGGGCSGELSAADWNAMRLLRMRNVSECSAASALSLGGLTLSSSSADADDDSPPPPSPSRASPLTLLFDYLSFSFSPLLPLSLLLFWE